MEFVALGIYFLPTIVVLVRGGGPERGLGVIMLNTLAGWTIIGWILALVWALNPAEKVIETNLPAGSAAGQQTTASTDGNVQSRPATRRLTKVVQVAYQTGPNASLFQSQKKLERAYQKHLQDGWSVASTNQTSSKSFLGWKTTHHATIVFEKFV